MLFDLTIPGTFCGPRWPFGLGRRSALCGLLALAGGSGRFDLARRGWLAGSRGLIDRNSGCLDLAWCSRLFGVSKRGRLFKVAGVGAIFGVGRGLGSAVARVDCGGALGWAPYRLGSA
jgi:hypothetical protein